MFRVVHDDQGLFGGGPSCAHRGAARPGLGRRGPRHLAGHGQGRSWSRRMQLRPLGTTSQGGFEMSDELRPFASRFPTPASATFGSVSWVRAGRSPRPLRLSQGVPHGYLRELCATGRTATTGGRRRPGSTRCPVPCGARRPRHPFPARPLAAPRRDPPDPDPRLAGLDRRVPEGRRAAHRPHRPGGEPADAFHLVTRRFPATVQRQPSRPGWGVGRIAGAWAALMAGLGYTRTARRAATGGRASHQHRPAGPRPRRGHPLIPPIAPPDPATFDDLTEAERSSLASLRTPAKGFRLLRQPATRPQTVGIRWWTPRGLCAWIVEKFWAWTDCDGHPENR